MYGYCFRTSLALLLILVMGVGSTLAAEESHMLFNIETAKKVKSVFLTGEKEESILITNKERIFVYDSNTGKLVWEDKVPGYTDEGVELVWNAKYYVVSTKNGMRCYEIATGKVVWETKTLLKMKEYSQYFNFSSGFVLCFGAELMGFDPNTGEVRWTSAKLDWNKELIEEKIPVIWSFPRDYGDRLLVLGNKVTQLLDAATGKVLGTIEMEYTKKTSDPISEVGNNAVVLFGEKNTKSVDLRDGKELWTVIEQVDPRRGYVTFDYKEKHYAVFGLKKALMLLDLDEGRKLWETGEDMAVEIEQVHLYENGILLAVGIKNFHTPNNEYGNRGGYTFASGLDFATGTVKYKTLIAYATEPTLVVKIPLIGTTISQRNSVTKCDFEYPDGALFYSFGYKGRQIGKKGTKWEEPGGEGLVLMDPATGEIKWRTNLVLFETWQKGLTQAGDTKGKAIGTSPPGLFNELEETPPLVIQDGYAYLNANNAIVKVDLKTGKTVWEGPKFGLVSHFSVSEGRVFGEIGYSRWDYKSDADKRKAEDAVFKSDNNGYFVLDDANGKPVWMVEKLKSPIDLFFHKYVKEIGGILLCDGMFLRRLNLQEGKYDWEIDLKKDVSGEIGAQEGVVFVLTGVSYTFDHHVNYYTVTTTKSYKVSMEHGVFGLPDGALLVIAKKGPAVVDLNGKVKWSTEWDWKRDEINFTPQVTDRGIVYQYKKKMYYISLKDGSVIWEAEAKEAKDTDIFLDANRKRIFIIEEKNMAAYRL